MDLFGRRMPKEKEKVLNILKREFKLFLRLYTIAKKLYESTDEKDIKRTQKYFKQLRIWERREQWRWKASVSKLKDAMNELLRLPVLSPDAKSKIEELVGSMSIYEGDLLKRTVEQLGREIERLPKGTSISAVVSQRRGIGMEGWSEMKEITGKLIQDLQALTALDQEITKLVKG